MTAPFNPNSPQAEAVANACAHMNDAGLPNVHALVQALNDLAAQYRAVDNFARMSSTYNRAVQMVEQIRPHLASSI